MRFLVVISFAIYMTSVKALDDFSYDLRFPIDEQIIQATLNKDDLIYMLYKLNENKTTVDYYISDVNRTCGRPNKIELDADNKFQYFQILPLNQDKILLVPRVYDSNFNEYSVRIEIVNFSSCQRTEIALPTKDKPTNFRITRYVDSFDIYYKDSSTCKESYCRTSYDFQGNIISNHTDKFYSIESIPLVKAIGSISQSNKSLVVNFTKEKTIVYLADSNKINVLTEITDTKFIPEVSTSNNLISIAYRVNFTNVIVKQFDSNGNLKFESLVKKGIEDEIRTVRIINSAGAGVYLLTSSCDREHCNDDQNVYSVNKFDANGKEVGSTLLKFLSPGIIEDLSFYEQEQSHCVIRVQLSLGVSGRWQFKKIDVLQKCFTDEDLAL